MVMALETVQDGEAAATRESQQCPHSVHQPLLDKWVCDLCQ